MDCTIEKFAGVTYAVAAGRLDFDSANDFQAKLVDAIADVAASGGALVIDCTELAYVSSAGLRSFLVAARTAKSKTVALAVCGLSAGVQDVFEMSGFNRIIVIRPDRAAALQELGVA